MLAQRISQSGPQLRIDCGAITDFSERGFGFVSQTLASRGGRGVWFHISDLKRSNRDLASRVDSGDLSQTWLWYRIDEDKVGEFYRHSKDIPTDLRELAEMTCRERFLRVEGTLTESLKRATLDLLGKAGVEALTEERIAQTERIEKEKERESRELEARKAQHQREIDAYIDGVGQVQMFLQNHDLSPRQAQIREFCKRRNIKHLIHFTRVSNVPSILQEGLQDRSSLEERRVTFSVNDELRLDQCRNAVCMSMSFPNYQMFYRYRQSPDARFAVLVLNPDILWAYACAFCFENAASKRVTSVSIKERLSVDCLESMFGDHPDVARESLGLPPYYPTSPQAEVLAFPKADNRGYLGPGSIHPAFIEEIHVNESASATQIRQSWDDPLKRAIISGSPYFAPRQDWSAWRRRIDDDGFDEGDYY